MYFILSQLTSEENDHRCGATTRVYRSLMCGYTGKRLLCFVEEIKEMWEASYIGGNRWWGIGDKIEGSFDV